MPAGITRRTFVKTGAAAAMSPLVVSSVRAQAWPSKPIRFVVGYPAGGLTDLYARAYAEYITRQVGQPVIVENKAGAGGTVGALEVKRAAPDGHTLMFTISTTMIANRLLYKNLPYDPDKDFVLISSMSSGGLPMLAGTATGASNLKEFIDYARKNKTNVGTYAPGSAAHIAFAELNKQYGLSMEPVHYRGEVPMWTDLASGSIHGAIGSWLTAQGVLASGKGKAIAVTQEKRNKKLPDVGTFFEQGATSKVFGLHGYVCAVGPAGMPDDIVNRYSDMFVAGGKSEKIQQLLELHGIDESAIGRKEFQKLYAEEGPIALQLVGSLGLTPE